MPHPPGRTDGLRLSSGSRFKREAALLRYRFDRPVGYTDPLHRSLASLSNGGNHQLGALFIGITMHNALPPCPNPAPSTLDDRPPEQIAGHVKPVIPGDVSRRINCLPMQFATDFGITHNPILVPRRQ